MELGNQIKALRLARGVTQEVLAEKLGVSAQAVSKWERGATVPDVQMLPELSAYFGVTIDSLFALTDETRMERIQNMVWDEREISPAVREREEEFLLELARREPGNGRPHELLAMLENHAANVHRERAAEYAMESLNREPAPGRRQEVRSELMEAMGGKCEDWNAHNHYKLINWYKEFLDKHPDDWSMCMYLLDQLLDDGRLEEAREYCGLLAKIDNTFRTPLYQGHLAWAEGRREDAMALWEKLRQDWPDDWHVHFCMGDVMARIGRYEEAKVCYRQGLETQKKPRFTDGPASIAIICEIQGDYPGAIAALEEEIALLASDWDTTSGEMVDQRRREIDRLRAKIK